MEALLADLKAAFAWLLLAALAGVGVLMRMIWRKHTKAFDDHVIEFDKLKECAVTEARFEQVLQQMRTERSELHAQNTTTLHRIENKIDANEARAASTRHEIRDQVHSLALKLASLPEKRRT